MRLASKAVFEHGTFAAIVVAALAAWTLACGAKSSLKANGTPDSGAGDTEIGAHASGGASGASVSGGGFGAGGAPPIDAVGAGGGVGPDGSVVDGAPDTPAIDAPVADAAADSPQLCGDAVCRSGQACALIGGGTPPPCDPVLDAGTCPSHLVLVTSCGGYGSPPGSPRCTTPPHTPKCYDLPDGCGDFCECVCGMPGCYQGPGHLICARP